MHTRTSAINLITHQCFMASIDWRDAYYAVPVASEYRKYLRFGRQGKGFQFTCMPPKWLIQCSKALYKDYKATILTPHINGAS